MVPSEPFPATVIVSVYRNTAALASILHALACQTEPVFQILVSEDGCDDAIRTLLAATTLEGPRLKHLTQEDRGFRKTRALNRAIVAADASYLIFLDGDCIPHHRFVEHHLRGSRPDTVRVGRRIQLGPRFSARLLADHDFARVLGSRASYLRLAPALHRDGIRNYEIGFASGLLQRLCARRSIPIVGCNFSCHRQALESINGFDEDFEVSGVGEDSDVDWRLRAAGYRLENIKFLVPVYHLHHPETQISAENYERMKMHQAEGRMVCRNGLVKG